MHNNQFGGYTPSISREEVLDITIGIFFDGTLNNKTNTIERVKKTPDYKKHGGVPGDNNSYNNDWSNVARMWDNYDKDYGIYIEGIGTEDAKGDETLGYAFGTGATGIRSKVRKGCEEIVKKVKTIKSSKKADKIAVLTFDVFGFSRGAAAARNFVHEIGKAKYKASSHTVSNDGVTTTFYSDDDGKDTTSEELPKWGHLGLKLQEAGITIDVLKVRFLGIYDTVSSYSKYLSPVPNFSNDVEELSLNDIGKAQTVIHFIAENEHRENFDLTRVHTGIEKTFPGVHCDVGGAYEDGEEVWEEIETAWGISTSKLEALKKELVAEGWFEDKQLTITSGFYWSLRSQRDLVKTFSYIPLHFMADYGIQKDLPIKDKKMINETYSIASDALLIRVKSRLEPYVMGDGRPYVFKTTDDLKKTYGGATIPQQRYADYQKEVQEQKDLGELRKKYLHWSARREGIGMDPRPNRVRVIH
ncbi:T6SS phospholipase effector Tle1-like catalytic domain-containing protein [Chryseobacterium sp. SIMBA_028]|uniref:T6SS phospholipase effector Tle1-like catalytic domain-containing protein n=1 Tax=Chryseobacterium sp. SIMBA_028 TaxID=3085771 RepID=UPI00397B7B03